jgi:hypothetical protein
MKYYESHYDDYISSIDAYNLHPEIKGLHCRFPNSISDFPNLIVYGSPGIGKYSQVLHLLKRYSPSDLKYEKRITINTEKQQYIYKISDMHYEIDMSLLGCNSKLLWHEVFFQIVDIISVKQEKIGVILCKNFHTIHAELLEIFYSYMQQYNYSQSMIKIKFVIITEHMSFIPTQIINNCQLVKMKRPTKEQYLQMITFSKFPSTINKRTTRDIAIPFVKKITDYKTIPENIERTRDIITTIDVEGIINIKELNSFSTIVDKNVDMPKDNFNTICDNIIQEILTTNKLSFTGFRDILYDILTYNLDVTDCLWYILKYLIHNNLLTSDDIPDVLDKTVFFLKYYNNNYRPIYHLESIMFYIINKIHKL